MSNSVRLSLARSPIGALRQQMRPHSTTERRQVLRTSRAASVPPLQLSNSRLLPRLPRVHLLGLLQPCDPGRSSFQLTCRARIPASPRPKATTTGLTTCPRALRAPWRQGCPRRISRSTSCGWPTPCKDIQTLNRSQRGILRGLPKRSRRLRRLSRDDKLRRKSPSCGRGLTTSRIALHPHPRRLMAAGRRSRRVARHRPIPRRPKRARQRRSQQTL